MEVKGEGEVDADADVDVERVLGWAARSGDSALLRSGDEVGVHAGAEFGAGEVEPASSRSFVCRSSFFGLQDLQDLQDLQLNDQDPRSPSCLDGIV